MEGLTLLQLFFLLFPLGPAPACHVDIAPPHQTQGTWVYDLTVDSDTIAVAGISVAENGADVTLALRSGDYEAVVDVAPTRYAVERVIMPTWGSGSAQVVVRGFEKSLMTRPTVAPICATWRDRNFLPLLAWQAMATGANQSEVTENPTVREATREAAMTAAGHLLDPSMSTSVAPELAAGAEHERGFILARRARHMDATAAFVHAEALWRRAGKEGPALAAQFNVAQELLAAGHTTEAMNALRPMLAEELQNKFPGIATWARNDYCLALRALDRRSEAVRCFSDLVPRLQAARETKEASNALCNWGAALGTAHRWGDAARVMRRCVSSRQQIGLPVGLAHAYLLSGWVALEEGEVGRAVAEFERSLNYAEKSGDASRIWEAQRWLAQARLDDDELALAKATLLAHEPDSGQEPARFEQWRVALGQVALADEDLTAAGDYLRSAASRLSALGLETAAVDARCQLAQIDLSVPIATECDETTAAQAYLARGSRPAEFRVPRAVGAGSESEVLRQLVQFKALSESGQVDVRRARGVLRAAMALNSIDSKGDRVRERLLARIGFEFAQLTHAHPNTALGRLAFDALLAGRAVPTPLSVDLLHRTSRSFGPALSESVSSHFAMRVGDLVVTSAGLMGTTYLVIGGARDEDVVVCNVDTAALRRLVEKWRYAVTTDQDVASSTLALSEMLQISSWWRPGVERLIVATHGALSDIAWAALAIKGDPEPRLGFRPILDEATVVQLATARARQTRPFPNQTLGIFAEDALDDLPGAMQEVGNIETIARNGHWQVEKIYNASGYRGQTLGILHIAGHATTDRVDASRNTLLASEGPLGQPIAWPEDWVSHSGLVVLAGCDTADGPPSRWQSAGSLARRSLDSGASMVLAHLWPIPDTPAARLHTDFYQNLFAGDRVDVALAKAQRERMRSRQDSIVRNWASAVVLVREQDLSPSATVLPN